MKYLIIVMSLIVINSKIVAGENFFTMGGTYDSSTQTPTATKSCLIAGTDDSQFHLSNFQSNLDFSRTQNLKSVEQALGVNLSIRYNYLTPQANYNYARSSQDDDYNLNINYIYQTHATMLFNDETIFLGEKALTAEALNSMHNSTLVFRQNCGDSFIASLDANLGLLLRINLKFHSLVEKRFFTVGLKNFSGLDGILNIIKTNPKQLNYTVNIAAIQLGGKSVALNQLFNQSGGTIGTDGYSVLYCGLNGEIFNSCLNLITKLINYAPTINNQVSTINDYYFNNPIPKNYSEIRIDNLTQELNPQILIAQQELNRQYQIDYNNYQLLLDYYNQFKAILTLNFKQDLINLTQRYQQLMLIYTNQDYHLSSCFLGMVSLDCPQIKTQIFIARADVLNDSRLNHELEYLKTNHYLVNLLIDPIDNIHGYCELSAISNESSHLFGLNCNGQISGSTNITTGIMIKKLTNGLTIQNLSYHYLANNNLWLFNYYYPFDLDQITPSTYFAIAKVEVEGNNYKDSTLLTNVNL